MTFYPMLADVYYADTVQKPSGKIEKEWSFGRSVPCELKTGSFNTEMRYALQTYDEFFVIPTILYGRFAEDVQQAENGKSFPVTEILVTNIRTNSCIDDSPVIFVEPHDGSDDMVPVVYEIRSLSPFINPWGQPEHYKIQLMRSDNQEVQL